MNQTVATMISHFPEKFAARIAEWTLAIIMTGFGFCILFMDLSALGQYYGVLFQQWPPYLLASMLMFIGLARFSVLMINGLWGLSPMVRMFISMITGALWMQVSLGVLFSHYVSPGCVVYPVFVLLEMYNVYRAATDVAKKRDLKAKLETQGNGT